MAIQQNGYVCYAFSCDHDGCSANTLMSSADQLSAALRLSEKGWGFELGDGTGPAVTLCPTHAAASVAPVVPMPRVQPLI